MEAARWGMDAGGESDLPDLAAMTLREEEEVERLRGEREAAEKARGDVHDDIGLAHHGWNGSSSKGEKDVDDSIGMQQHKKQGSKSRMSARRMQKMMKVVDECFGVRRGNKHKGKGKAKAKRLVPLRGGGEEGSRRAASEVGFQGSRLLGGFRQLGGCARLDAAAAAAAAAGLVRLRGGSALAASRNDPELPQSQIRRDRDDIVMIGSCAVPIKVPRSKKGRGRNRQQGTEDGLGFVAAAPRPEPHICTRCGR